MLNIVFRQNAEIPQPFFDNSVVCGVLACSPQLCLSSHSLANSGTDSGGPGMLLEEVEEPGTLLLQSESKMSRTRGVKEGAGTSRGGPWERSQQLADECSDRWSEEGRRRLPPFPGLEFVLQKDHHPGYHHLPRDGRGRRSSVTPSYDLLYLKRGCFALSDFIHSWKWECLDRFWSSTSALSG